MGSRAKAGFRRLGKRKRLNLWYPVRVEQKDQMTLTEPARAKQESQAMA